MNRNDGAVGDARKRAAATSGTDVASVLYDLIVDHPMWIGDNGRPLDYLPEREGRIADFIDEAAAAISEATQ